MHRVFVGMLCCLLTACVTSVEESDPIDDSDPAPSSDTWQPQNPNRHQPNPCAPSYDAHGFPVPVQCRSYWLDMGDPPPDLNPAQKYQNPSYEAPNSQ
jgi:hypothetical protein